MTNHEAIKGSECPVLAAISISASKGEAAACEFMKILYWSVEESKITIEQASDIMIQDLKQIKKICGPCTCPYSQMNPAYRNGGRAVSVSNRTMMEKEDHAL